MPESHSSTASSESRSRRWPRWVLRGVGSTAVVLATGCGYETVSHIHKANGQAEDIRVLRQAAAPNTAADGALREAQILQDRVIQGGDETAMRLYALFGAAFLLGGAGTLAAERLLPGPATVAIVVAATSSAETAAPPS